MSDDRPQKEEAEELARPVIGKPGEVVRAINFSGGGFDTAMELGVIHALLVSQGRAPDAVVGISAGALHATGLADVLQAGAEHEPETPWHELPLERRVEVHELRTAARVVRFRRLLGRLEHAPEELVDQLFPDAYQINSLEPLRPTDSPVFLEKERKARLDSVDNRSGLVRLYNDLLGLGVTFGTVTRVVRRILGWRAAGEVATRLGSFAVRVLELLRLWILIGTNLRKLAPILTRLAKAYFLPTRKSQGQTAGFLIFRFRPLTGLVDRLVSSVFFVLTLFLWGTLSMTLILFPLHVGRLLDSLWWTVGLYAAAVSACVMIYAFNSQLREFERTLSVWGALRTLAHGLGAAVVPIAGWIATAVIVAIPLRAYGVVERPNRVWFVDVPPPWLEEYWVGKGVLDTLMLLTWAGWPLVMLVFYTLGWIVLRGADWDRLRRRVLRYYRIEHSLLHPYPLERFLSRLFDPEYYGRLEVDRVVDEALAHDVGASRGESPPLRSVGSFAAAQPPIQVGISLADLHTGKLAVAPPETALVDALVGAMSVVPFFPPRSIDGSLYVDASNLANEPMQALFALLRDRVHERAQVVHVYSVASLPFSRDLERRAEPLVDLVEVAGDGLMLHRYRDAQLERRLTHEYTEAIPPGRAVVRVNAKLPGSDEESEHSYIRAWVTPIEPDEPIRLNQKLFRAAKTDTQRLIRETIADGCRAALESMIGPTLARRRAQKMSCAEAVEEHIRKRARRFAGTVATERPEDHATSEGIDALAEKTLPGCHAGAPGLEDVCEHCALVRRSGDEANEDPRTLRVPQRRSENGANPKANEWFSIGPAWPHERELKDQIGGDLRYRRPNVRKGNPGPLFDGWPRERAKQATGPETPAQRRARESRVDRPTVSFLFSGGVFRGVFQLGALNALSELGLRPDVIAGASVGSITGAMTAAVFAQPSPKARRREIARLAGVYLALDRIVLTDRFADFVRNLTVRAAEARFSLRQADRVFRKYDVPRQGRFEREARVVFAGIERLLYISPFELARLTQAIRDRDTEQVAKLLEEYGQEWLDRMGVGLEVLGAEPLELLIREFVLESLGRLTADGSPVETFADLAAVSRARLLATSTNVHERRLELLGGTSSIDFDVDGPGPDQVRVDQGLLAGSAFPAVFRPRWSHEVFLSPDRRDQFMDGGVMDNLPLQPVSEFLRGACQAGAVQATPKDGVPHLLFAASLEPRNRPYREERASWPMIHKRAKELSYNGKLGKFAATQRHLRALRSASTHSRDRGADLELVVVEPEWLCGTFAFHPMLGFRRAKQAASIAHGCASTLLRFAAPDARVHLETWGGDVTKVPEFEGTTPLDLPNAMAERPFDGHLEAGTCWLSGNDCPFSKGALKGHDLAPTTSAQLEEIHRACLKPKTHRPPPR